MNLANLITPFRGLSYERLVPSSPDASAAEGLFYTLNDHIVVKLPTEYAITNGDTSNRALYLDNALQGLASQTMERSVYEELAEQPHANIAKKLDIDDQELLFLERLQPLLDVWKLSTPELRRQWAMDLINALSWLEKLGFTHGDLTPRNLGVDQHGRLKIFNFGSATPSDHEDYDWSLSKDHYDLATCLHVICTGIDPHAAASTPTQLGEIKEHLANGRGTVSSGAEPLQQVIQAGWTNKIAPTTIAQLRDHLGELLKESSLQQPPSVGEEYYQQLEAQCKEWLRVTPRDERWIPVEEYCAMLAESVHNTNFDDSD